MADTVTSKPARNRRSIRTGFVYSDKGDKSITVEMGYLIPHRIYGKYIRRRTRLHAHDERNEATVGDTVEIMECRPVSKNKHWRLVRVVKKAQN